jgi:hypothetical protein
LLSAAASLRPLADTSLALSPSPRPAAALQHPDKCKDDEEATKKFQALSFIHSILSDPAKRKDYDRTGA